MWRLQTVEYGNDPPSSHHRAGEAAQEHRVAYADAAARYMQSSAFARIFACGDVVTMIDEIEHQYAVASRVLIDAVLAEGKK